MHTPIDMPSHSNAFSMIGRFVAQLMAIGAIGLLASCMLFAKPPANLDYGRTRRSETGLLVATIRPVGDSIPKGKLHRWMLHIESSTGTPVDSATITMDGGMPQHGHGLPTKPQVTRAMGHGDHLVEGVKFNMGGWWVVKFRVNTAMGRDSIVFNLSL